MPEAVWHNIDNVLCDVRGLVEQLEVCLVLIALIAHLTQSRKTVCMEHNGVLCDLQSVGDWLVLIAYSHLTYSCKHASFENERKLPE
eukprot:1156295-Pelagomonas_calceolata.AAC.14